MGGRGAAFPQTDVKKAWTTSNEVLDLKEYEVLKNYHNLKRQLEQKVLPFHSWLSGGLGQTALRSINMI